MKSKNTHSNNILHGSSQSSKSDIAEYNSHLKSHCNCIVCGANNPIGLKLKFEVQSDGSVHSHFKGSSLFQGYSGILHGGMIATFLDATMNHCLFHNGIQAVTADLQIRFLLPVPYNAALDIRASFVSSHSILYKLKSELSCDNQTLAKGQAKFMKTS